MWGSSSGYIGSSSDPSGSITNIAQYIEDYIDLVENIPNDIARHVSRLHEYNNRYYQLLDKLEKIWKTITHCSNSILTNGGDQLNGGGNTSLSSSFSSSVPTTITSSTLTSSSSQLHSSSSKTEIKSSTNIKNNHTSSSSSSLPSSTTTTTSLITKSNSNYNINHEIGNKSDKNSGNGNDLLLNYTTDSRKGLKAVVGLQKCLIEIQEISDEKLFIVQSILDQLDCKARQLDYDHRSVTIGNFAHNLNSNASKGLASLIGASNDTTNHISDANGLTNNVDSGGGGKGGGEITSTKDNSNLNNNGTSLSATVNNNCTSNTLSNKRSSSRRNLSNKQEISNGEITSNHKRGVKRGGGVKGSKDIKRNKSTKEVLNTSPPTLYEDTPIDPDEPTYCSCEQVSYGEMICCDNAQCPIEWFHFACVSLTTKPKGKWYCPNCRGDRSNIPKK
ncbi:inhibitor of growth protein 1-like [Panonychus citri]|uniref:inhibitor of growth protein 1-like n=1 Tax=Panonychus citri TaxID=50023 RepID=UPI0023079A71|nr:inhibitor of growth protein 1-like [Panonychus citri]